MQPRLHFHRLSPSALKIMLELEKHFDNSSLGKALAELVRIRISQINGCAYCLNLHSTSARNAGESDRRLATLSAWREAPFFTDRERAALQWAESVTRVADTHVPDDAWEQVKPHFTPEELVDLTLLVNAINSWNRIAISFRTQLN